MEVSVDANEPDVNGQKKQRARASASGLAILLRLVVVSTWATAILLYFVVDGHGDAPDTFSLTSWTWMLLPPVGLAASLILGYRLRTGVASRFQVLLSRATAVIVISGFLVASLASIVWFYGEWMDYTIG